MDSKPNKLEEENEKINENTSLTLDNIEEQGTLLTDNISEPKPEILIPAIDKIIEEAGYCSDVWRIICLFGLLLSTEGIYYTPLVLMFTPIQVHFKISHIDVATIGALMFLSIAAGSFMVGFLVTKLSRKVIIICCLIGIIICSILMGAIDNVYSFAVFRTLMGFFMGIMIPIGNCILAEYMPLFLRSFTLGSIWVGYQIGGLYLLLEGYLIMPNLEPSKVLYISYYSAIPVVIILILIFFLLFDLPRN